MKNRTKSATLLVKITLATLQLTSRMCLINSRDDIILYILYVLLSICLFYQAVNILRNSLDFISNQLLVSNESSNLPGANLIPTLMERVLTCRTWGAWVAKLWYYNHSMGTQKFPSKTKWSQLLVKENSSQTLTILYLNHSLFRYVVVMRKEELMEYARREIKQARNRYQESGDDLLFPVARRDDLIWGSNHSDSLITPKKLAHMCSDYRFPRKGSRRWDEQSMAYYLDYVHMEDCYKPKDVRIEEYWPNFAPLYDYFCVERKRVDMWAFNPNVVGSSPMEFLKLRNVDYSLLTSVMVKEIIIGVTPAAEILEIDDWWRSQYECDQLATPNKLLSLDVEERSLPKSELEEYLHPQIYLGSKAKIRVKFRHKERGGQLPVKIMFGNGHSWCVMITLPFPEAPPEGEFVYADRYQIQPELVELFRRMPCITGVGVGTDYSEVVELVRTLSGDTTFSMNGYIDLSSMAALAGMNFPIYNMQAMSVQLFGGILNKNCSPGDAKWGIPWLQLPDPLKIYCLGDVKFGHMVAVLLYHLLINDMFPDPDIVQSFLRVQQQEFGLWFADWVISVLEGTEVVPELFDGASTREGLINSLKERVYLGKNKWPRSTYTPERVLNFYKIRGNWPSLTNGGPRYLHQVRNWFLEQEKLLSMFEVPGWKRIMPYPVDAEMREAATYAVPEVAAGTLDYNEPTEVPLGLTVHNEIKGKTLHGTELGSLSSKLIATHAENNGRIRREMTYETVRLDVGNVESFFKLIRGDRYYKKFMRSYYDEIRAIVQRCTGQLAPRIPWIERTLLESSKRLYNVQRDRIQALKIELDERMELAQYLFDRIHLEDGQIMTQTWRGQLPKLAITCPSTKKKGSRTDYNPVEYLEVVKGRQSGRKPEVQILAEQVDGSDVPLPLDDDEISEFGEKELSVEVLDEVLTEERIVKLRASESEETVTGAPSSPVQGQDPSGSENEVEITSPGPSSVDKPKEYHCKPLPYFPRTFTKRRPQVPRTPPPSKKLKSEELEKLYQDEVEEFDRWMSRGSSSPELFQSSDSR